MDPRCIPAIVLCAISTLYAAIVESEKRREEALREAASKAAAVNQKLQTVHSRRRSVEMDENERKRLKAQQLAEGMPPLPDVSVALRCVALRCVALHCIVEGCVSHD